VWTTRPAYGVVVARLHLNVPDTPVGDVDVTLVSPRGTRRTDPLPLVVAGDGPEYSRRAGIVRLLDEAADAGRCPRVRVALLHPGERNGRYAANPDHAASVVEHVLPAVGEVARTEGRPVMVGASLGALAALQTHWRHPEAFSGLLLQSGSFFLRGVDGEESFEHWRRVTGFVREVRRARRARGDTVMALTCGADEGNLANNREMARVLERLGYETRLTVVPGRHDWPQWRRSLEPTLPALLRRVTS
jgi:enterochelin esterase-like enzyme